MKLTAIILIFFGLHVSAKTASQSVTLSGTNLTLESVFAAIEKQTGYIALFNEDAIKDARPVTIHAVNQSLERFLMEIFKGQPLQFTINNTSIVVNRKKKGWSERDAEFTLLPEDSIPAVKITGTVRASTGELLVGATVHVKGLQRATLTDATGKFSIDANNGNVLIISYIGYENEEVTVQASSMNVTLKVSHSVLDETQITAYGKTTRRFATGSIGTVKAEEIERQPVMNIFQALEGKVPGLVISPTSGNSAAPVKVEIRGLKSLNPDILSEPLYVVDGLPLAALQANTLGNSLNSNTGFVQGGITNTRGENPLLFLNPRDIESIDVLKDIDATAIYGARGANGVILITTKKGKAGPTSFNMNINRGSVTIPRKLDLMSTEEYLAVRREAFKNDGIVPTKYNAPDLTVWDQHKFTDWQDYFYKPGSQTAINAGISGGVEQTNYGISASYFTQEELNNNGGKNTSASLGGNISHTTLNRKFQFDFSSRLSITNIVAIPASAHILMPPNAPDVYNERGEFNFEAYRGEFESTFPFAALKMPSQSRSNTVTSSLKLRYEPIKGLHLSMSGAYQYAGNENARFEPLAALDPFYNPYISKATFGKSTTTNWSVDPQIAYTALIGKGNFSVQLGGTLQSVGVEGLMVMAQGFADDNLMRSPNNAPNQMVYEGSNEYRFNGGYAIVNYRWDNKYIINLSGRRDGSSKFGPGKQIGNFGSVGVAWIASQEKWMENILPSWFNFLKFSGSYGIAGSDAVGEYEYLTRWGSNASLNSARKLIGYNGATAINMLAHTNKNFRWQSTSSLNAAVMFGLLEERISMGVAYYQSRSGNQLTQIGTPYYTGFDKVRANWNAVVQNSGVEFTLNAKLVQSQDWHLTANFNIGKNVNKLIRFPGLDLSPYANSYDVGKSLSVRYVLRYTGINPITGELAWEDHNMDGTVKSGNGRLKRVDSDDRYVVYDFADKFNGGMGIQLSYKSLGLYAGFVYKKTIANDPYFNARVGGMTNMYIPQEVKDNHWKQPGDIAKYPKYTTTARGTTGEPSDASFLQMNNLALSFDVPQNILSRIKIRSCQLAVNTQNIFTITSFRGIDPRINSMVNGTPTPRVISTSLTFGF